MSEKTRWELGFFCGVPSRIRKCYLTRTGRWLSLQTEKISRPFWFWKKNSNGDLKEGDQIGPLRYKRYKYYHWKEEGGVGGAFQADDRATTNDQVVRTFLYGLCTWLFLLKDPLFPDDQLKCDSMGNSQVWLSSTGDRTLVPSKF